MTAYEKIKDEALAVHMETALCQVEIERGNLQKALEHARKATSDAKNIVKTYPDEFAAYIVYMNASSVLFRLLEKEDNKMGAFIFSCDVLFTVGPFLCTGLEHEHVASLFLTASMQLTTSTEAIMSTAGEDKLELQSAILMASANITYFAYIELKKQNPDNIMVKPVSFFIQRIQRCGFEPDTSITASDIPDVLHYLNNKIYDFLEGEK